MPKKDERATAKLIEKKSDILGGIYSNAYLRILDLIDRNAGTMWKRDRAKRMLSNLNGLLKDLDKETQDFIKKEVPALYKYAGEEAKYDLAVSGKAINQGFSQIHKDAIDNIAEASKLRFAESMAAVKRDVIGKIVLARKVKVRETIAVGQTLGKATPAIAREVKDSLVDEGITSLVDKAGKKWKLDTYAKMLTKEMLADTSRSAVENIAIENDFDVGKITRHGATDACRFHEGKYFSFTGKTKGLPTLEQLKDSGEIFHIGCLHGYFIAYDYAPDKIRSETVSKKRLDSGKKISNYDAKKNPGKSQDSTLAAQEKRKANRKTV